NELKKLNNDLNAANVLIPALALELTRAEKAGIPAAVIINKFGNELKEATKISEDEVDALGRHTGVLPEIVQNYELLREKTEQAADASKHFAKEEEALKKIQLENSKQIEPIIKRSEQEIPLATTTRGSATRPKDYVEDIATLGERLNISQSAIDKM